nr:nucleolar protein 4-like [Salvelinus alpinus]
MSCGECQKRMHISPGEAEFKENDRPTSLVPDLIDYNMPLTTTYLKQMKLQCMSTNEQDETSVSSEDFDMSDPTWISADHGPASDLSPPNRRERMHSPQNAHIKEEDDDSSSGSGSGNGMHTMTLLSAGGAAPGSERCMEGTPYRKVVNGNRPPAPLDFSTTSSSSSSEDQQAPVNLSETRLPGSALMGPFQLDPPDELRRKYPVKPLAHAAELRLDRDSIRDYGNKSPQYSSGSYDSLKMETCAEDLTVTRGAAAAEDDDDDHEDHDDSDKINDTEGKDPERLKAFNMFVRLFVDENLDRMVPISKQPKEKIQAIIESCSRQFPEFELRARKRIRTYLKSCRRMKKNGMEVRTTSIIPPLSLIPGRDERHGTELSRLVSPQEEQIALDKPSSREPASLAHSAYSLAASAYSQDQLYINGGLNYSYRGYGGLGASMQHPVSLTTATAQSNGPTDLSMKSLVSNSSSASSNSHGRSGGGGGSGASAQLSPTEITAVRQLIAGYRESAAFLLRSADELETLILQQN